MKIITSEEFDNYFHIKIILRSKSIALIRLVEEDVQCTRIQFYTQVFNIFEKSHPEIPLPLRLYSDQHLAFQDGWSFLSDESIDFFAE